MTERPQNHFRRLVPYGLFWGAGMAIFYHIWSHGFSLGPNTLGYWISLVVIWCSAGMLWAYLTAKYSKPKTNNNEDIS